MECSYCHKQLTFVVNSRPTKANSQIWRRRQCSNCKEIFTTHEIINLSHLIVVKKSRKPEVFSRTKLYSGIYGASLATKPIPQRERLVGKITTLAQKEILSLKRKRIYSWEIGEIVLRVLRKTNTQIFLRFLMYFKDIKSEAQLKKELSSYLT